MVRGWCRTNKQQSNRKYKAGHDAKKMKTCAIVAEPIACRGVVRCGCVEKQKMSLDRQWVRCMVVRFGFFAHTSQFNAYDRKWSTAEVLHGAHQYTQEQRDGVTE